MGNLVSVAEHPEQGTIFAFEEKIVVHKRSVLKP